MKKLLVLLALSILSLNASAEWVLRTQNKAGGEILLTNSKKGCPAGKLVAIARLPEGTVYGGCYNYDNDYIYVLWDSGDFKAYGWSGWEKNPALVNKNSGTSI